MVERIKLYMTMKRHEAEALCFNGSHQTVALLGMQMCAAALTGDLYHFNQGTPEGRANVAEGWPDPLKFAPPDLGCR